MFRHLVLRDRFRTIRAAATMRMFALNGLNLVMCWSRQVHIFALNGSGITYARVRKQHQPLQVREQAENKGQSRPRYRYRV
jgi:hypothetical protein